MGWVRPYESEAGLWSAETANSAGTCSAFLFGASTSPCVKNYTSPKMSQSAPASYWLFPAAAAPENEWNWNSCYITCTIPGSAVLHSIILYQNGHSGTEPSKIVSTATFPQHSRFCVFLHAVNAFSDLKIPRYFSAWVTKTSIHAMQTAEMEIMSAGRI